MAAVHLSELLQGLCETAVADVMVSGMALDSRKVVKDDLFFALAGTRSHGSQYIEAALKAGAVAVLAEACPAVDVPCVVVKDLKEKVGLIAERFYQSPSQQLRAIGVTGTNGKTSCCHFIAQALNETVAPAAVIGTLGNGFIDHLEEATHTTPDAITLHAMLRRFVDGGAKSVTMEVSSHGLEQGRVAGVHFDVALFTNLSRDHLDYHGGMDAYGRAKAQLFQVPGLRGAVVNGDDAFGQSLLNEIPAGIETLVYSLSDEAFSRKTVRGRVVSQDRDGMAVDVETPWGNGHLHTPLLGRFNAGNLLAVLATLLLCGVELQTALQKLAQLQMVPGRVERFGGTADKPLVVVDYAHTPDALHQVLLTLREHCDATLWCVFGCGGDRDQGKRPQMGEIADRYADRVVLTDDNPRHEDGDRIITNIRAGIGQDDKVIVLRDRAEAIRHAVQNAAVNDVVLVAGKGHETWQQVGDIKRAFSDREQVCLALGVAA
jgi:UDP-N-acetylmuramoyl-L-alanyl-D-glutamate--2,6-diaminopimelate ligase